MMPKTKEQLKALLDGGIEKDDSPSFGKTMLALFDLYHELTGEKTNGEIAQALGDKIVELMLASGQTNQVGTLVTMLLEFYCNREIVDMVKKPETVLDIANIMANPEERKNSSDDSTTIALRATFVMSLKNQMGKKTEGEK